MCARNLVSLIIQSKMYGKNGTKIINALDRNGSRIKRFRELERSGVDEALLKWFKRGRSDDVPVSSPLLLITFFFLNFNFQLMNF
jgi:hypothetical protein